MRTRLGSERYLIGIALVLSPLDPAKIGVRRRGLYSVQGSDVVVALESLRSGNHDRPGLIYPSIVASLAADPSFSDTKPEATWFSLDGVKRRKPDVQTVRGGQIPARHLTREISHLY